MSSVASLNDLWFYDPVIDQRTWVKGSQTHLNNGFYGTLGVPDTANSPGARTQAASFATSGALRDIWMLGGFGLAATSTTTGYLNDLWRLDLPNIPSASTVAASAISASGAALNASIITDGQPTSLRFKYGTDANLTGASFTPWQSIGSVNITSSLALTGLNFSTTYYFQAEVFNSAGASAGAILSFTTSAAPDLSIEQPAGTVLTDGVSTVAFGNVTVASTSTLTFTLKNLGTATLTTLSASIGGTAAADFSVSTLPATLGTAGSSTFTVTFTAGATGARAAALQIISNDPDESPLEIALTANAVTSYQEHAQTLGLPPSGQNTAPTDDFDGDGIPNVVEIAFGGAPANPSGGPLYYTGNTITTGQPVVVEHNGWCALFVRRKNAAALGITYTVEFSADLNAWQSGAITPTVVSDDGSFEVACMPYPSSVGGLPPKFFRVRVTLAP